MNNEPVSKCKDSGVACKLQESQINHNLLLVSAKLDKHIEVEEVVINNQAKLLEGLYNLMKEIQTELNDNRQHSDKRARKQDEHHDSVIRELQTNFDIKMNECNNKIMSVIEEHHPTFSDIEAINAKSDIHHIDRRRGEIEKAIYESDLRTDKKIISTENKAKIMAWVAGTVMGGVMSAIGLAVAIYNFIIKTGH